MLKQKDIGYLLHKSDMTAKNVFTSKLNEYGITPGQLTALREIYHHIQNTGEIGLSPALIADRIYCDRPTVTGIIERLEVQGWITRLQNPEDKRSFIIQLTKKAADSIIELNRINKEHQDRILTGFTEAEAAQFRDFLIRVMDNFRTEES